MKSIITKVLIVGYGSIGKRHLQIVREHSPSVIIKIFRHKQTNEVPLFSDGNLFSIDQIRDFAPQVAIVANPASFHLEIALILINLHCHLLIEKPLSNSLVGLDRLIIQANSKELVLQVGYNLCFLPSLEFFRQTLFSEKIGGIYSIRSEVGQYLPSWRPNSDYRTSVSARFDLGGGVLLELSHELDYLRWIFGEVDWVQAWIYSLSKLEIDVEDIANLIIGFKSKDSKKQTIALVSLDFLRHDRTRSCSVIGERGSLRWDGLKGKVDIFLEGKSSWETIYEEDQELNTSYRAQWKHFLDCVENGSNPVKSGKDGLEVLKIIEVARLSNKNESKKIFLNELTELLSLQ